MEPAGNVFRRVMDAASEAKRRREERGETWIGQPSSESRMRSEQAQASRRGLPPAMWGKTFEAFDISLAPAMREAVAAARSVLGGNCAVMLAGGYGCGKTHLGYAVANECRETRRPYRFVRANDLMKTLRNAISQSRSDMDAWTPDEWIDAYAKEFVLVLDDLGAHQQTDFAAASLFDIIDARYRQQHPTLITTNEPPPQIDGRIMSRFRAGFVACDSPDQRRRFG